LPCLEVDCQAKFGRLLHWQIGRLLALENPAGIHRRFSVRLRQIGAITHEAASQDILAPGVDRSHADASRKGYDPFGRRLFARGETVAVNEGFADSKLKGQLADLGGTTLPGSPADFGKLIADETEKWGKVVRIAAVRTGRSAQRDVSIQPASVNPASRMSAPGQTLPSRDFCGTAALPLEPDIGRRRRHGSSVPQGAAFRFTVPIHSDR
jgi:hypothetical protein